MITLRTLLVTALLASLTLAIPANVQAGKVQDEPGYVDLDWIEIPDSADEVQDIDLTTILKSVASDAKGNGDDQLAEILSMVRSIRVKGFSLAGDGAKATDQAVKKITKELKADGWKRLIYVKEDDEMLSVNTRYSGEDLVGLMVVVYEPGEEVMFANVVGDLDLPTLMMLVGGMDGDGLDDLLDGLDEAGIEVHDH